MLDGINQKAVLLGSIGVCLLLVSLFLFLFVKKQTWIALCFLVAGTFFIKLAAIYLSPFVNWWDEQFHALVAKNMMENPLKPMLYSDPVLPYDYHQWTGNHIWLHKQPMFLWQMAIGMSLFGTNEFGLRIHMVIMATILSFIVFRVGKILKSERVGIIASILFATNYYGIILVSGQEHTDHNDFTFMFHIFMSCWAYFEYQKSGNILFALIAGLFSGFAILTKWLTGLLVFSAWGLSTITDKNYRTDFKKYIHLALAIVVCVIIFLPWQIYISNVFPLESSYEFSLNTKHFFEDIEGHGEKWNYHFIRLTDTFMNINYIYFYLLIPIIFFFIFSKNNHHKIAVFCFTIIPFVFFTISKTKMPAFTYITSPFLFLMLAFSMDIFLSFLEKKTKVVFYVVSIILIGTISLHNLQIEKIFDRFSFLGKDKGYYEIRMPDTEKIKELNKTLTEKTIIFHCRLGEAPLVMFYTQHIAYESIPDRETIITLLKKGYHVAFFDSNELPDYVKEMDDITIIYNSVWR